MTHAGGPGSNPYLAEFSRFVTLNPLKLQQCTLHFGKPLIFSIWTREVKNVAVCSVYDMLSGIPFLHEIENVCKHSKETVVVYPALWLTKLIYCSFH